MAKIALAIVAAAMIAWVIVAPGPQHTVKTHTFCDGKIYCRNV